MATQSDKIAGMFCEKDEDIYGRRREAVCQFVLLIVDDSNN
jgi:hypothetical protein